MGLNGGYRYFTNNIPFLQNKEDKGTVMDFRKMLLDLAESQAEKMQDEAMGFIASDEFGDMIAKKINDKIDIPFVSEDKEQIFFERVVDIITDVLEGVFKGK